MKISKLLIPVVLTASIPPISVLVGCSNNKIDHTYDKITSEIKQDAISEFIELSKIYRETYFTRGICNWLKQRIQEICPEATILEDDYNASLEDSTVDPDKSSGNLIIDIPASPGMENNKKICFQAHMDMVCVADSPEALEQMKQNGVSVEINSTDNTMTSAGKHTSLGADDGIGVAIMLALLKNKNIAHGPIKYIITADEENGGGAKWLGHETSHGDAPDPAEGAAIMADCDTMLNVDNELEGQIITSTAGNVKATFMYNAPNNSISSSNEYELVIDGLIGGHSGDDIGFGRANAIVLARTILNKLNDVQLISFTTPNSKAPNAIVNKIVTNFISTQEKSDIETQISECLSEFKKQYPNEKNVNIGFNEKQVAPGMKSYTDEQTKQILEFASLLPYGVISWKDKETSKPETSENIGPFSFGWYKSDEELQPSNHDLSLDIMARSCNNDHIDSLKLYHEMLQQTHFADATINTAYEYGWAGDDDQTFIDFIYQKFNSFGVNPTKEDLHSGIEISFFKQFKPTIYATSIGPTLRNVHSWNETLELNTIDSTIKVMLACLDHMKI